MGRGGHLAFQLLVEPLDLRQEPPVLVHAVLQAAHHLVVRPGEPPHLAGPRLDERGEVPLRGPLHRVDQLQRGPPDSRVDEDGDAEPEEEHRAERSEQEPPLPVGEAQADVRGGDVEVDGADRVLPLLGGVPARDGDRDGEDPLAAAHRVVPERPSLDVHGLDVLEGGPFLPGSSSRDPGQPAVPLGGEDGRPLETHRLGDDPLELPLQPLAVRLLPRDLLGRDEDVLLHEPGEVEPAEEAFHLKGGLVDRVVDLPLLESLHDPLVVEVVGGQRREEDRDQEEIESGNEASAAVLGSNSSIHRGLPSVRQCHPPDATLRGKAVQGHGFLPLPVPLPIPSVFENAGNGKGKGKGCGSTYLGSFRSSSLNLAFMPYLSSSYSG